MLGHGNDDGVVGADGIEKGLGITGGAVGLLLVRAVDGKVVTSEIEVGHLAAGDEPQRVGGTRVQAGFFEVLGVARNASRADVRRAYVRAAKRYHPDALARAAAVSYEASRALSLNV